ncbi:hypothetical protein HN51_006115 [Arachis hypogaea]|uniref:Uncharacterized protein n=1 Tax=Arachis hypogaea TaxID=3818 RepID=A0A445DC09_ARAHY|nr:uncharacterized protein LOC112797705 [Arachis hypogaea]XP_025696560.1 uncharacterized protein LOC112797705 [Arachis hypogaea]QHO39992.1 uncharacterized protein DS421_4g133900 [Arachis hypogaea]QHO39993.1 uncharacterized protein DS421_4g133900 [Arachis hypogaea]QHO39994.1 uncharacterized protein DS421_4g133900 [Arachis hypogaea]QHO39995.1 uncharacterized protein DS421_4g133900 [Arachis hypogaea]RYR60718.1 hypothetical protein Ahy_A04g017773 [Arachis hypogaea]
MPPAPITNSHCVVSEEQGGLHDGKMSLDLVQNVNVNVKLGEAAPKEVQVLISKESVTIPTQNVNGKSEEAVPQEIQVVDSKENITMPMQNVNGKSEEAVPLEIQEEAVPLEIQVVDSKENIVIPTENVNGKHEEAALQEVQAAVSKESVAIPVATSSVSEQTVVLHPGKRIEQTPMTIGNEEDIQVNIIGIGGMNSGKVVEDASEDCNDTELSSSSSFGDTGSCEEIDSSSGLSDDEMESPMGDDWGEPLLIRKKKVTSHWRSFIRPLMWRCKWLELQMRKLHSQEVKYQRELASYNYKKQLEFSKYAVDGFDVKSIPISTGIHRNKVMRRKKRKRAEESDLSSYVSNHNIFSYYENKDLPDGSCMEDLRCVSIRGNDDNIEESIFSDMWYSIDREDIDKSLDDIFQKIATVELQVQKLRTRIDNVVSENPGKFCSVTQLSMVGPSDGLKSLDRKVASFAGSENIFPVGVVHGSSQIKSELHVEDVLMPGNTSTREGITPFIETTNQPHVEGLQESGDDEVLIQDRAANEKLYDLVIARKRLGGKTKGQDEEQKSTSLAQVSEPDSATGNTVNNGKSALKACSTSKSSSPRNKRRKQKKSGSKSRSRR